MDPSDYQVSPEVAATPVAYEVYQAPPESIYFSKVQNDDGSWRMEWVDAADVHHPAPRVATFTAERRMILPRSITTSMGDMWLFAEARFSVALPSVRAGDKLALKPYPDRMDPLNVPLTTVDCGDTGFLSEWEGDAGLCQSVGDRFVVGDVSGEGRADVVCHSPRSGAVKVGLARQGGEFVQTDWQGALRLCRSKSQLRMGDVNGDGRADLLCRTTTTGVQSVALARGSGRFPRVDWRGTVEGCRTAATRLLVGDVSGDGRADLVCQRPATGRVQVALARAGVGFSRVDWRGNLRMCRTSETSLQLGKVNRDARADLVCQDPATGLVTVALAGTRGRFPAVDTRTTPRLCTAPGTQLRLGDVTGDARADLVCQDTASGRVWLAVARSGSRYPAMDWQRNLGFCPGSPGWLQVADLDGDGRADLLCHHPATGHLHTAYSDL